ncbi:DUF72 domain-containing protein [Methylocella sp.]|uniref:DUF72 domain-containing protein n=1 Tax=Methylocella sp. TaxID=1978226 RepID=UPI0037840FF9
MTENARIAVAGWSVARPWAARFPETGSHLERYAARLSAVEVNSSFYRPHRPATYARWAASTPDDFSFAVKAPREITHIRRLVGAGEPLRRFLDETSALGRKRGPVLVQTPPSLRFDRPAAEAFFSLLRSLYEGFVAFEPRHASWFTAEADALLGDVQAARVAADPAPAPGAGDPGGWGGLVYLRLHGSPVVYRSAYAEAALARVAALVTAAARRGAAAWCVFDNTAEGAATGDALRLCELTSAGR